jgi:hypothetical protein
MSRNVWERWERTDTEVADVPGFILQVYKPWGTPLNTSVAERERQKMEGANGD